MLAKNPTLDLMISLLMKQKDGFTKSTVRKQKKREEKKRKKERNILAAIQRS